MVEYGPAVAILLIDIRPTFEEYVDRLNVFFLLKCLDCL